MANRFFVTSWTDGSVGHYDTNSGSQLAIVRLGPHPTDMVWAAGKSEDPEGETPYAARLFIAAANTNSVYTLGVSEDKELRLIETINTAMTPRQPAGMTPSGAGARPEWQAPLRGLLGRQCGGGRGYLRGAQPRGRLHSHRLVSHRGARAAEWHAGGAERPRRRLASRTRTGRIPRAGPRPATRATPGPSSTWAAFRPARHPLSTRSPTSNSKPTPRPPSPTRPIATRSWKTPNPFPPIQHVIYIVKENRSYDQVLGDMKEGNGDPSLVLFGEKVTPNEHKLARQFVLLDNFYVNADVSADGHTWSTAAIATDYIQKMWPNSYAKPPQLLRLRRAGADRSLPPAGYLWTNAAGAGISMRNYGYMAQNLPKAGGGRHADRTGARPGAEKRHQPALSRLRSGLPGRGARQGFSGRPGGV